MKPKPKSSKVLLENLHKEKSNFESSLKTIRDKIEEYTRKKAQQDVEEYIYECPSCSTKLSLYEGSLKPYSEQEETVEDYETLLLHEKSRLVSVELNLKKKSLLISKLEELQPFLSQKIPEIPKEVDPAKISHLESKCWDFQNKQKEIAKLSKTLESKLYSGIIREIQRETDNKKAKFPEDFKPGLDIQTLTEKKEELSLELENLRRKYSERKKLTGQIRKCEKSIKELKDCLGGTRMSKPVKERDIDSEISELQKESNTLNKSLQELIKVYSILQKRETYRKDLEHISNLENDLNSLEDKLNRAEKDLRGALGLMESTKEAEILSLERAVSSINQYAKIYLEKMFENDICVKLQSVKQTKNKTKIQMNVSVEYHGHKYNNIHELSGGEKQRCELAFLLAVNDMLGSKILLLDECLNNLDLENNTDVLLHLKNFVNNKLVLVVSPEAVQGVFDSIIEI